MVRQKEAERRDSSGAVSPVPGNGGAGAGEVTPVAPTARKDYRSQIESYAKDALAGHVLTVVRTDGEGKPFVWKVRNPEPVKWSYWYFVAELPGAIVQYGDIGGLIIEAGQGYDLGWLDGAMGSMDYVLEKSKAKRDHFVEELFKEYLAEHGHAVADYEGYEDFVTDTGDTEAYECVHDWPAEALWAYWALHKFVELRRAEHAALAATEAPACPTT